MDIMTGLSAVAQALNIVKSLREVEKQFDAAEFKLKIADLNSALTDAKLALSEAKTEMDGKQAEIDKLIGQFQVRTATVEHAGYKYERGPEGRPVGFAFCPVCESNGTMIRTTYSGGPRDEARCPKCKAVYGRLMHFPYPQ